MISEFVATVSEADMRCSSAVWPAGESGGRVGWLVCGRLCLALLQLGILSMPPSSLNFKLITSITEGGS